MVEIKESEKKRRKTIQKNNEDIESLKRRGERNMEIIKKLKKKIEEEGEIEALTSTLKTLKRRKVMKKKQ